MIDPRDIRDLASSLSLDERVVEKDYVLGWLLAGIANDSQLSQTWIFKGGTCLKKMHFETYRFSEDLDFTLTQSEHLDEPFLLERFREIAAWVYDQSGIRIPSEMLRFELYDNPRGGRNGEGRVYYQGPLRSPYNLPKIKLDITADEVLVLDPERYRVFHPYADDPPDGIWVQSYAYTELFAEKIRALHERARPRDLYDVMNCIAERMRAYQVRDCGTCWRRSARSSGLNCRRWRAYRHMKPNCGRRGYRCSVINCRPRLYSKASGATYQSSSRGSSRNASSCQRSNIHWRLATTSCVFRWEDTLRSVCTTSLRSRGSDLRRAIDSASTSSTSTSRVTTRIESSSRTRSAGRKLGTSFCTPYELTEANIDHIASSESLAHESPTSSFHPGMRSSSCPADFSRYLSRVVHQRGSSSGPL